MTVHFSHWQHTHYGDIMAPTTTTTLTLNKPTDMHTLLECPIVMKEPPQRLNHWQQMGRARASVNPSMMNFRLQEIKCCSFVSFSGTMQAVV